MFDTFCISFRLRISYRVNTILYSLKQLPLIKKLLPASLYQNRLLKGFALVLSCIWEVLDMLVSKGGYLGVIVLLPAMYLVPASTYPQAFLHILFFLSIAGAISNNRLFAPTKDKYYAIILMRMDARQQAVVNYCYELGKIIIGSLVFLLAAAWFELLPYAFCFAPFYICAGKCISAWWSLRQYERKKKIRNENSPVAMIWTGIGICWALAYLPLLGKWMLPTAVCWALMALALPAGLLCLIRICRFSQYRAMYQVLLKNAVLTIGDAIKQNTAGVYQKSISADTGITSQKHGFAYFNDLFVKRHQRMLWRNSKRQTIVMLVLFAALAALLYAFPAVHGEIGALLPQFLPYFIFLVYSLHSGKSVVQAMFRNCDHSMLTYSFYRRPDVILKLFAIRLRTLTIINLPPALCMAFGLIALLHVCGGADSLLVYLIILLCILAMSVFFSIHYLTCYYLLQPYNEATETKSSTYNVVSSITYLVCFGFIYLRMNLYVFGCAMIVFSILYAVIACNLVYRKAGRTFRLRR